VTEEEKDRIGAVILGRTKDEIAKAFETVDRVGTEHPSVSVALMLILMYNVINKAKDDLVAFGVVDAPPETPGPDIIAQIPRVPVP